MIFYTTNFVGDRFAGSTRGPLIFIRPEYKDDVGLLEHEKTHRWQWIRTIGLHSFLYLLLPSYRLSSEVEAYKVQLQYCSDVELNTRRFARFISTKYNLDVSEEEAYRRLVNE